MPDWEPPLLFDEYQVLRPIGRGGMGQVYLAQDLLLDRPVAVKFVSGLEPDRVRTERFRLEGRAVARLAHPNVVAVHRVGEVDGRPYLVSEYVRGRSLEAVDKPMTWLQVLPVALGMARGLAAAHRRGVLHRDLKPGNVMLASDGSVKLVDFGLAKLVEVVGPAAGGETLSQVLEADRAPMDGFHTQGDRLGTPLYMAPETLRGEHASRRSDLYSLGAVLFELCTNRPPRTTGRLLGAVATPLRTLAPAVEPRFAEAVDRCLADDPAARFGTAEELLDALEPLSPEGRRARVPQGNPYRGLRPFDAEHRDLFFGRDGDVRDVLERLRSESLVIVTGDSGVGKSSLCRAGVLPRAEDGELGARARVYRLAPGRAPLRALASALSISLETPPEALEAWIRSDPEALARTLRKHQLGHQTERTLIFIDQLEELFTLASSAEAQLFAEVVQGLTEASGLHVLATVRGDFFTRLAALSRLGEEVARSLYLLRPLTEPRMRETIVGPARLKGVTFESEALVDELLASAGRSPGGLPLLQFALAELWDGRDLAHAVIPAAVLARIGGVEGALARHADEVLARLLPHQREAARRLLLRLVTEEGTRSQGGATELGADGPEGMAALEALVQGRLLVAQQVAGVTAYQLAHEALLRAWGTLRAWVAEDGDRSVVRNRLEAAAEAWWRLGSRPEELWRARQLAEAEGLDQEGLTTAGRAFLLRSREAAWRERALRLGTLAAVPFLLLATLGGAWLKARLDTRSRVQTLLGEALRSVEKGGARANALEAGRRTAFQLYDADAQAPADAPSSWGLAERTWEAALGEASAAEEAYREAGRVLETALFLAPDQPEPRAHLAALTLTRHRLALEAHAVERAEDLRAQLEALDPGGAYSAALARPAQLTLLGLPAGSRVLLSRLEGDGRVLGGQEGPADSWTLGELAPGAYQAVLISPSGATIRHPVLLAPGEQRSLDVGSELAEAARTPAGFVFIPGGPFLYGSAEAEETRSAQDGAPPSHPVLLPSYAIGATEETLGQWIAFLEHLPPSEREARTPRIENDVGSTVLTRRPGGGWAFAFRAAEKRYDADWGVPIRFAGRANHAVQDWRRFPVMGVSPADAVRYARWLATTGQVPGARLCTEREWEKAARGVDGRPFLHGARYTAGEANIDATHGRGDGTGPEEVGTRDSDRSVYGVSDLVGNVFEVVVSDRRLEPFVARGSGWAYDQWSTRLTNRQSMSASTRSAVMGVRICTSVVRGEASPTDQRGRP